MSFFEYHMAAKRLFYLSNSFYLSNAIACFDAVPELECGRFVLIH